MDSLLSMLMTEQCMGTLKETPFDLPCLKISFSKLLGLAIVLLAPMAKIPQIINIVKGSSVKGLSYQSLFIEVIFENYFDILVP